jgi:plasmid maintenance system antidote protein VapI
MTYQVTPPHPGRVVERDLRTRAIPLRRFADRLGVDRALLERLIAGETDIDVALSEAINEQLDGNTPTHLYQLQQDHNRWKKITS